MSKKVFFQLVDTLAMGGTERMSVNMATVLHEAGWESHLIVSRNGGGLEADVVEGVQVHFLGKKSFYDIRAFWRLMRLVKKKKPTVFHAHSTSIYWVVALKIFGGNFLSVWHDHFGLSDRLDSYPRKDMIVLSKWIDRIVTVNQKLEDYWKGLISYKASSIQTIGNFPFLSLVPVNKFPTFTFLNLANFRPQKDQLNLLKAIEILSRKGLDFQVLLVGEYVDQSWKAQVEHEIQSRKLENWVNLMGPSLEVSKLLGQVHAGILSSESEGLPVALLEYGLAGLPVICTAVGDCTKVISSRELGWIVPPKNAESLAVAMEELMKDQISANQIGIRLREKVEKDFGKQAFLSSYFSLLKMARN